MTSPPRERVVVKATRQRRSLRPGWPGARELTEQTARGEQYVAHLMRTQLRIALWTVLVCALICVAAPLLLRAGRLWEACMLGLPIAWLPVVGGLPAACAIAGIWLHRRVRRVEDEFRREVERG
ncbi:MAG: hypothetical protein GEV11_19435 [Streptosporangiales bacterium]|nr:hypothetical protein [Streptosporangiales bacterium]